MDISLKNIWYKYNDKNVLSGFSVDFQSNKLSCLLGDSGSGKTTILRLIAGLEVPVKGKILIGDKTVSEDNKILIAAKERNIGFVFQDLALWPHFTVYQNIAFGLKVRRRKKTDIEVNRIMDFFKINDYKNKYPHQLSGGQKQLTAIARALILEPEILLMDEPLSNLDVNLKSKIIDYIAKIKKEFKITIIYVTHDIEEIKHISDEIITIK